MPKPINQSQGKRDSFNFGTKLDNELHSVFGKNIVASNKPLYGQDIEGFNSSLKKEPFFSKIMQSIPKATATFTQYVNSSFGNNKDVKNVNYNQSNFGKNFLEHTSNEYRLVKDSDKGNLNYKGGKLKDQLFNGSNMKNLQLK
jgi:hypothetical protein